MAALGSLAHGLRDALHNGEDFQWSGAKLLGEHVDPWKAFLDNDPDHPLIMAQMPNYQQELYVMLLPLGRMSFPHARAIWCGCNLVFLVASLVLLARMFALDAYRASMMACVLLIGSPLRVTFSNGQQCLLVLLCFTVAYTVASRVVQGLALGVGFAKYTFAPIVVMVDLLRLRLAALLWAAVPLVAGLLIVWRMTGTPLGLLVVEPLRSAKLSVSPGYGDVMTAVEMALPHFGVTADRAFSLATDAGLACAAGWSFWLARRRFARPMELALLTVLTLVCFKHVVYDFIFLVVPAAALLGFGQRLEAEGGTDPARTMRWIGWAAIFYLEIFGNIKHRLHPAEWLPFTLSNMLALLVLAWVLVRANPEPERAVA
jgi:hypothetical protein